MKTASAFPVVTALALAGALWMPAAPAADADDPDGDGVPAAIDECPNTPPGHRVLSDGCLLKNDCRRPRAGEPADDKGCALEQVYILHGVNFEFDSDRLTPGAQTTLKDLAVLMETYPDLRFELDGHTCTIGSQAYNLKLSDRRAKSAMAFLVSQGIDAKRLRARGFGYSMPVDTNKTEKGREMNRRVELKIIE